MSSSGANDTPRTLMDLSVRSLNGLHNNGIKTDADFAKFVRSAGSELAASLLRIPNVGRKALAEITQLARNMGLLIDTNTIDPAVDYYLWFDPELGRKQSAVCDERAAKAREAVQNQPALAKRAAQRARKEAICAARDSGLTLKAVGQQFGIGVERVRGIVAQRDRERRSRLYGPFREEELAEHKRRRAIEAGWRNQRERRQEFSHKVEALEELKARNAREEYLAANPDIVEFGGADIRKPAGSKHLIQKGVLWAHKDGKWFYFNGAQFVFRGYGEFPDDQ